MFGLTADQRGSRRTSDLVPTTMAEITAHHGSDLLLPPDQNAGDELQLLTASASTALDVVLELTRAGSWSVGLGIGTLDEPLPKATRMARGSALVAARAAVERAKRHPTRFALETVDPNPVASDAGALASVLIALRDKRSDQGWAVYDALREGLSQRDVAKRLSITPQAVGHRVLVASIRTERDAYGPLVRLLSEADAAEPA